MSIPPYSCHTFLFPFLWNDGGKTKRKDFERVLSVGKRWIDTSWKCAHVPTGISQADWLQNYAAYQYFTEPANAAIFNTHGDNTIVSCLEYRHRGAPLKDDAKYIITKDAESFPLEINAIRMHLYDSGVAILILELENRQSESLGAVNKINEYGRRINMPFLAPGGFHPLCADRIEILFGDTVFETEDYRATLDKLGEDFQAKTAEISLSYIMKPIQKLIDNDGSDNGGAEVTTKAEEAKESSRKYLIRPCVDDRMFVCCLIRDDNTFRAATVWDASAEDYAYLSNCAKDDHAVSDILYSTVYIENKISCVSRRMKKELLTASVYDRWIDYGTLYATTHHSLFCITGEDRDGKIGLEAAVYNPFLNEYVQLAILALAQRATILALLGEASAVAEGLKDNSQITPDQIDDIERLQAKYVKAQNQLFLAEATVQEQGVEIYNRIREHLYIGVNKTELDAQMTNLRDVANISNDRLERRSDERLNKNLSWLTLISLGVGIVADIPVFFDPDTPNWSKVLAAVIAVMSIAIGCCLLKSTLFKGKKEDRRK